MDDDEPTTLRTVSRVVAHGLRAPVLAGGLDAGRVDLGGTMSATRYVPRSSDMVHEKEYPYYTGTKFVSEIDYATLEAECRWAMEQYLEARKVDAMYRWPNHSPEWHLKILAKDTGYQRAQSWLAANPPSADAGKGA